MTCTTITLDACFDSAASFDRIATAIAESGMSLAGIATSRRIGRPYRSIEGVDTILALLTEVDESSLGLVLYDGEAIDEERFAPLREVLQTEGMSYRVSILQEDESCVERRWMHGFLRELVGVPTGRAFDGVTSEASHRAGALGGLAFRLGDIVVAADHDLGNVWRMDMDHLKSCSMPFRTILPDDLKARVAAMSPVPR